MLLMLIILSRSSGTVQLLSECEEWFQQFPHLRCVELMHSFF